MQKINLYKWIGALALTLTTLAFSLTGIAAEPVLLPAETWA